MRPMHLALVAPIFFLASAAASVSAQVNPLRFFAGRTETQGMIKVVFKKAYYSRSLGEGRIEPDGSLTLVQRVEDEGKPPHERRWHVHEVGSGRWAATMSDATSPVAIDKVGDGYRFRFTMKGNLSVEQWLTPLPGATAAHTVTRIRKFGLTVATTEGTVRKLLGS